MGNLRTVDLPDGRHVGYLIDGRNRRVGKKIDGVLVQGFLYGDQLNPVAELDGTGQVDKFFVYGTRINVPEYLQQNGRIFRIISDHLGSPRLVIDVWTGEVVARMENDAFGRKLEDTDPGLMPFGFAGGIDDRDIGLVRFGARDYDARAGRWTAKDPIGLGGGDVQLYWYAAQDPINAIDPAGLYDIPVFPNTPGGDGNVIFAEEAGIEGAVLMIGILAGYALLESLPYLWPLIQPAAQRGCDKAARVPNQTVSKIGPKIVRQMGPRGWTPAKIQKAIKSGKQIRAVNRATGNPATRYVHSNSGQSVVIDDLTGEVIHVGRKGFVYGPGSGDLP